MRAGRRSAVYVQMTLKDLLMNIDCKKCYYGWYWDKCLLGRRDCNTVERPAPDADRIINLFREGARIADIAKQTGTNAGMVAAIIKELT